jgi:copper chaperone CopZ
MKTIHLLSLLLAGILAGELQAESLAEDPKAGGKEAYLSQQNPTARANILVSVKGMVCSFCAQGITKKLKALPEVEGVTVRMSESMVYIVTRKDAELSDDKISKILTEAGYTVNKIIRRES